MPLAYQDRIRRRMAAQAVHLAHHVFPLSMAVQATSVGFWRHERLDNRRSANMLIDQFSGHGSCVRTNFATAIVFVLEAFLRLIGHADFCGFAPLTDGNMA